MIAPKRVLLGDVGGTNARFVLAHWNGTQLILEKRKIVHTQSRSSWMSLLKEVRGKATLTQCVLAIAGPFRHGSLHMTHTGWIFSRRSVGRALHLPQECVVLMNDFHANALAIPYLRQKDLLTVHKGKSVGPIVVLGAGTGFGTSALIPVNGDSAVLESEAGHARFAPQTDEEAQFSKFLGKDFVSNEDVLSGRGLELRFQFSTGGKTASARDIVRIAHKNALALQAITLFLDSYARVAQSLALTAKATGGTYFAGGMIKHLLPFLQSERLKHIFQAHPTMGALLRDIPLFVIKTDSELLGCAVVAKQQVNDVP